MITFLFTLRTWNCAESSFLSVYFEFVIRAFHQSSVLIQANETTTEFYSG